MINRIKVRPDTFEEGILLFNRELITSGRVNVLFGGNGVGKTTLLKAIKNNSVDLECSREIEVMAYTNSIDNDIHLNPMDTDPMFAKKLASRMDARSISEGQAIIRSFIRFSDRIQDKLDVVNGEKSVVVIMDEIDSGLSVENINFLLNIISDLINRHDNIQFFISSNSYHFVHVVKKVIDMYKGEYTTINSYEEYFNRLADEMVNLGDKRDMCFTKYIDF